MRPLRCRDAAARLAQVAAEDYRSAVRVLVDHDGLTKADVAALLDVSPQRVSQLVPGKHVTTRSKRTTRAATPAR